MSLNAIQIACCVLFFNCNLLKKQSTEETQYVYIVGYCLKSMGCWIWPVSCWSHQCRLCCGWSALLQQTLQGQGSLENMRSGKMLTKEKACCSWRLLIITHWHSNGLISPYRTKNYSPHLHHLSYHNHNNTLLFLLSYIIHENAPKNGYHFTWEGCGAFTCSGMKEWTWSTI